MLRGKEADASENALDTGADDLPKRPVGTGEPPSVEFVGELCERVLSGEGAATDDELLAVLEVVPGTEQARVLEQAERALAAKGNDGLGYIYAQVGLDARPCPGNCRFCGFAACNRVQQGRVDFPEDAVLRCCELFAQEGVHLVSLMTTAACSFERYLRIVERAREVVGGEVALMANTRDLAPAEARALKEAGASCLYHAVRLGEGRITGVPEARRWQTLERARAAGLGVSTAVGPVYNARGFGPESPYRQTGGEVVARMRQVIAAEPFCSGVTSLVAVPGTQMAQIPAFPPEKMHVFGGAFQLAACGRIPFGGYGSVKWVDAGLDPRGRGYSSDDAHLRRHIAKLREQLEREGWHRATCLRL